jgi:cytidylate kinase
LCLIALAKEFAMTIFVIAGMSTSGKNTKRMYAENNNIPYFATGDIVRKGVKKQGLAPNAENMPEISTNLRGTDGMGVTRIAPSNTLASTNNLVFMERISSCPKVELIHREADSFIVAFVAPRELRRDQMASGSRADNTPSVFEGRGLPEMADGTAISIARADAHVLNAGTMDEAMADLNTIVKSPDTSRLKTKFQKDRFSS